MNLIRKFIWPWPQEIVSAKHQKWYQGLGFWYCCLAIIALSVNDFYSQYFFNLHSSSKIPNNISLVEIVLFGSFFYLPFIYLFYRRYNTAYILLWLSYYFFNFAPKMDNGRLLKESILFPILIYLIGLVVFRINYYWNKQNSKNKSEIMKDIIIALAIMEFCFYCPLILSSQ